MKLESLFGFNLQTGSLIVVFLHILGSIPFLVAGERLIADCFLFIVIPINISATYGILYRKPNFLWPQMILQALDVMLLIIIAVSIQSNFYSDHQPPEAYVDSWELKLWNSVILRTNYMTKIIGFVLILAVYLYFLGIITQFYNQLKKEKSNFERNLANIFLQGDNIYKEPLTQNMFLNDII